MPPPRDIARVAEYSCLLIVQWSRVTPSVIEGLPAPHSPHYTGTADWAHVCVLMWSLLYTCALHLILLAILWVLSILSLDKLRLREVKYLVQGHRAKAGIWILIFEAPQWYPFPTVPGCLLQDVAGNRSQQLYHFPVALETAFCYKQRLGNGQGIASRDAKHLKENGKT